MKKKLIIFGTGKLADLLVDSIGDDPESEYELVAYTIDEKCYKEKEKKGLPVIRFEEIEYKFDPKSCVMIVAVGYHKMNAIRAEKSKQVEAKGYTLASFVHSKADVSSTARIGKNVIIVNNVSIGMSVTIGDNVDIFSGAVISHDAILGNNVWVAPGSVVGGEATIGENCFLGMNSTIGNEIKIGANNFIGANALVTKNTKNDSVYIVSDTPKCRLNTSQFMDVFKFC